MSIKFDVSVHLSSYTKEYFDLRGLRGNWRIKQAGGIDRPLNTFAKSQLMGLEVNPFCLNAIRRRKRLYRQVKMLYQARMPYSMLV